MSATFLKYQGNGFFIAGVPARDLTKQEFDELPAEIQKEIMDSDLYVSMDKPKPTSNKLSEPSSQNKGA